MNFIILGAGPGLPLPDKGLSSIYVNHGDRHFLFDCGEGCSRQLLIHGLSGELLDAVFISHYHPDHISGIFMLVQMLYLQDRKHDLYLFLPERESEFEALLQFQYTFLPKLGFKLHILSNDVIGDYYPEVSAMQTDHLLGYKDLIEALGLPNQMRSWAFRIGNPGQDLVYTADIQSTDCVSPLLQGCHTVIVDALHPPMEQIVKLQEYSIPRVLLTHGISEELELWLRSKQPDCDIIKDSDCPLYPTNFELALEDIGYHLDA